MIGIETLREKWPWDSEYLKLGMFTPTIIAIVAAIGLYTIVGGYALLFLIIIPIAYIATIRRKVLGLKMAELLKMVAEEEEFGEFSACLMVINKKLSPGVVILRDSELELCPLEGTAKTMIFRDIWSVNEGKSLPGKFIIGKRTFNLGLPGSAQVSFAIPESISAEWSAKLNAR